MSCGLIRREVGPLNTALSIPLTAPARSGPAGRYAPSPTGDLHLGNLRTALVAWQDARRRGARFILRIEDLDGPRKVPGAEARLLDDLRWLGIDWDEGPDVGGPAGPYRQSERDVFYAAALDRLAAAGLTYLCTCSRRELRQAVDPGEASAPHDDAVPDGVGGPVYPGTCRERDAAIQRAHPAGAAVRFRVDHDPIMQFDDLHAGPQRFDLRTLCGDFVVRRRDGLWAYQLACAVDDALMGVTHVIRGRDLLSSTARQIALLRALALPVPQYGHIALVADATGARMCKRDGSQSIRAWRVDGMPPAEARARIIAAPLVAEV